MLAKSARAQRHALGLVALGQHLVLELGHVDAGGALGLAGLALDAEVERLEQAVAGELVVRQGAGRW